MIDSLVLVVLFAISVTSVIVPISTIAMLKVVPRNGSTS